MGTVFNGPEWWEAAQCVSPDDALEKFGWADKPSAAQVSAAVAYAEWYRNRYLVDRRDEIAAGFADIAAQASGHLEQLVVCAREAVESGNGGGGYAIAESLQNIARMLDLYSCGRAAK